MRGLLLAALLAAPAAAARPWLEPQDYGTTPVEVKKGTVSVSGSTVTARIVSGSSDRAATVSACPGSATNCLEVVPRGAILVSTVEAAVPIQRSQAVNGTYYSVTTGILTIAGTSETPFAMIVNLTTNTLRAYFDSFIGASLTNNTNTAFRIYRQPVVTSSGTLLSIFPGSGAVFTNSQMQAYSNPTVSSNGKLTYVFSVFNGSIRIPLFQSRVLPPGGRFLVTAQNSANNRDVALSTEWSEEP